MDNLISSYNDSGAIVKKYTESDKKLYMPMSEAIALSHELARRVTEKGICPDRIIGIANGALVVTQIIAADLDIPFDVITIRRKGSAVKSKLSHYTILIKLVSTWYKVPILNLPLVWAMKMMYGFKHDPSWIDATKCRGRHILLVDDATNSGKTLRRAECFLTDNGCTQVTTAVISISKYAYSKKGVVPYIPDIYIAKRVHHFPWSVNNPDYPRCKTWLKQHGLNFRK
jgi:hypoxanthine phosphoribosyltransferase